MQAGRTLTAAMIVFALVVVPSAAYVGGYYGLAETHSEGRVSGKAVVSRHYRQSWQRDVFKPAGRAEEWLTGSVVYVVWFDGVYHE